MKDFSSCENTVAVNAEAVWYEHRHESSPEGKERSLYRHVDVEKLRAFGRKVAIQPTILPKSRVLLQAVAGSHYSHSGPNQSIHSWRNNMPPLHNNITTTDGLGARLKSAKYQIRSNLEIAWQVCL